MWKQFKNIFSITISNFDLFDNADLFLFGAFIYYLTNLLEKNRIYKLFHICIIYIFNLRANYSTFTFVEFLFFLFYKRELFLLYIYICADKSSLHLFIYDGIICIVRVVLIYTIVVYLYTKLTFIILLRRATRRRRRGV